MSISKENLNLLHAKLVIDSLLKHGINHFIISPGLRNAPLMSILKEAALKEKDLGQINISISIDERAAAYMAIGQYKASHKPSVLICTSGTALANYYPALLEAKKSNTPIIILSADRPLELHLKSSNQTINQGQIFQFLDNPTFNLPLQDPSIDLIVLSSHTHQLIKKAIFGSIIHFNFPFRGPLDSTRQSIPDHLLKQFDQVLLTPPLQAITPSICLEGHALKDLDDLKNKKGLLVVGHLNFNLDKKSKQDLLDFIHSCPWPKIIDITTSLKYNFSIKEHCYPSFDHPEVYNAFQENQPEVILHLGDRVTSKKYDEFIKNHKMPLIHVNHDKIVELPIAPIKKQYHFAPHLFAKLLLKNHFSFGQKNKEYVKKIEDIMTPIIHKKIRIIEEAELSFPKVSKFIVETLAPRSDLYIGNSTAIRSFDSYTSIESSKDLTIHSHRGVSGIEGFIAASFAFHQSKANKEPTILVLGDISFLHDLNSLNLIKNVKGTYIILLINNYGGGIFSLVPFKDDLEIMPWMSTPHQYQFDKICHSFNIHHQFIDHFDKFKEEFQAVLNKEGATVMELRIDNQKNLEIYQKLKTVKL